MDRKKTKFTQLYSWSDHGEDVAGGLPVAVTPPGGERVGVEDDDINCAEWRNNIPLDGVWVVMARNAEGAPLISARVRDGGDDGARRSGRHWATTEILAPEGSEFHFAE